MGSKVKFIVLPNNFLVGLKSLMNRKSRFVIIGMFTTILVITTSFTPKSLVSAFTPLSPTVTVGQNKVNIRSNDRRQIIRAIGQNNKPISPNAPVRVDKITIVDDYAVAIVLVGEHGGGMSALKKTQSGWQVVGGGGGAFDDKYLIQIGVPPETAKKLMQRIQ